MSFLVIHVTYPSKPEAVRISADLLNARLVACANYFPIESTYWWEWRLTHTDEILVFYKTVPENWDSVKSFILSKHKNTIPCIIKLATVESNESYEQWIHNQIYPIS
jgi:periplasmic divalent cation tolerance protein